MLLKNFLTRNHAEDKKGIIMKKRIEKIVNTVEVIDQGIILFLLFCATVFRVCGMIDISAQEISVLSVILFTLIVIEFLCMIIEIILSIPEKINCDISNNIHNK